MSFSLIPPEINSALMFSGAGSGPLLEASTAWNALAADLESTATQYQTLVTNLITGPWLGPSSARMAAATAPYIAWLQGTAATAAQTGSPGPGGRRGLSDRLRVDGAAAGDRRQPGACWPSWWPTTSSAKTPGRSPPPKPTTWTCGSRTRWSWTPIR